MANVNLNLYYTFYVVAKYKSMKKAGDELMLTQPAVSKAIKSLENQIGGTLFNRSVKGLELTEEGKMLLDRIKPALALIKNAENEFDEFKKLNTGEIKIGISSVLTKCLLLDTLQSFKMKYPNIKITIKNGLTKDLISDLNLGKLDFVIYNDSSVPETDVFISKLTSLEYVFFYNPNFFNIEKDTLEDIKKFPLILQDKSSNTRKYLDFYTNNELVPAMEVVSQDLICNLVNIGLGVGFAFKNIVNLVNKDMKIVKLTEIPEVDIFVATNISVNPSFAAKTFLKELRNFFS